MDPRKVEPDTSMADSALRSLIDAVAFAAQKHRDQRRKDHHSSPYINHPIAFGADVARVVEEVSDDKSLSSERRKLAQIEHAPHLSNTARLVKLADKICNLRDVADNPPKDWSLERRREYFDWARLVIDGLRGPHRRLEAIFDAAYAARP